MKLPSKELVENVLDIQIKYLSDRLDENLLPYEAGNGWQTINIYEFSFKVKRWIFDNANYILSSYYRNYNCFCWYEYSDIDGEQEVFISSTEPEAIIKAGETILEKLNSKG